MQTGRIDVETSAEFLCLFSRCRCAARVTAAAQSTTFSLDGSGSAISELSFFWLEESKQNPHIDACYAHPIEQNSNITTD